MIAVEANITAARWHPRHSAKILVGTEKGQIYLYNLEKKQIEMQYVGITTLGQDAVSTVVDLLWNPGEDVFLALFSLGTLRLYGQTEKNHKMQFEAQTSGISKVSWMDNVSGDFITTSVRVGAIKIWNAAQP